MSETLTIFGIDYPNTEGFKAKDDLGATHTYGEGGGGGGTMQSKTRSYTPTTSAQSETVSADSGYDGLSSVAVTVAAMPTGSYGAPTWTKAISQGSRLLVAPSFPNFDDGYMASAPSISTTLTLEQKSVTPSETAQTVNPTSTDYYISAVNVGAIPSDYVGSGVTQRSSTDLTASGATVTAPAGYYGSAATKTVASGSATPAATISATGATVSTGTNTLTLSKTVSNTPQVSAGYITAGTAGNSSVSLTATVTTQAAQTIYPSTSDQTIASGRYLTGTQTIKAVTTTNLDASNILSGVTIKVGDSVDDDRVASVTGNVAFVTYYTGSSAPSSGTGSDNDIYLQTS